MLSTQKVADLHARTAKLGANDSPELGAHFVCSTSAAGWKLAKLPMGALVSQSPPPTNATIDQAVLIHALTASAKCLGVSFSGYCQEERECCSAKFGGSREKGAISPIGATVAKQKSLPVGHRFCSDGRRLLALVCHSDKCTVLLLE